MNQDIVDEARTWLGVPWLHQGRTRDGVDCVGLVQQVSVAKRGYTFDLINYTHQAQDETLRDVLETHTDHKLLKMMAVGDIVAMRFGNQRHVAIVGDYPQDSSQFSLIHSTNKFSKVVEHRLDATWSRIIMAVYTMRDYR